MEPKSGTKLLVSNKGTVDIDRFCTNQLLSCSNKSGLGKEETELDNSTT
jgi:hypothetical protein